MIDSQREIQARNYIFPYHYIPNNQSFPMFCKPWEYSPSWLAALEIFDKWLVSVVKSSGHLHLDVGCGDGAVVNNFLNSKKDWNEILLHGVDIDERAILWAKMFSPRPSVFTCGDLGDVKAATYDTASIIEVFEHIPPHAADVFVMNLARILKPGGQLFLTVPSVHRPVSAKHYRHFTIESLAACFQKYFSVVRYFGFAKRTLLSRGLFRLTHNRVCYLEMSFLSRMIVDSMKKQIHSAVGCDRLCFVMQKN